jgi:uncharacterized delta-60 repeat protein
MFAVVRYNPDGSLDPTFGTGGIVTTRFSSGSVQPTGLAAQADGKLVAAGGVLVESSDISTNFDMVLIRYLPNGSLDPTFGRGGKVTTDFAGRDDAARAIAVATDGKLVVAGESNTGTDFDFAMARYRPNGKLDPTFGRHGKVTTDFTGPDNSDAAAALAIQADGEMVAAGFAFTGGVGQDFALARYRPNGSLDPTFGSTGKLTTDFAGPNDAAKALAVQPDGRVVAAGVTDRAPQPDFALARYLAQ